LVTFLTINIRKGLRRYILFSAIHSRFFLQNMSSSKPRPKSAGAGTMARSSEFKTSHEMPSSLRLSVGSPTPARTSSAGPTRSSPRTSPSRFWTAGSPMSDTGITNDMLDAKLTRKRAESDLQLLSNRVALLKLEETKALSKVNETTQRADQIEK
jgi:hypothetical protein